MANQNFLVAWVTEYQDWRLKNLVTGETLSRREYFDKYGFWPDKRLFDKPPKKVRIKKPRGRGFGRGFE